MNAAACYLPSGMVTFHERVDMWKRTTKGETPPSGACLGCGKWVDWNWNMRRFESTLHVIEEEPV